MDPRMHRFKNVGAFFAESLSDLNYLRKRYTVNGDPTVINSPFGKSLSFDAGADSINCGNGAEFLSMGTSDITTSIWIKTSGSVNDRIIAKGSWLNPHYMISLGASNFPFLSIYDGVSRFYVETITDISDGSWHNIVAVLDRSNSATCFVYIDGVDASNSRTGDPAVVGNITSADDLTIAKDSAGSLLFGELANPIMFYRTLTQIEADNIYKGKAF